MKKIILLVYSFFVGINIVWGETLHSTDLPYYAKIKTAQEEKIINIKKVVDKNNDAVFNIFYDRYDTSNNFVKYNEYDKNIYKLSNSDFLTFLTIVYYGYNLNPSDYNYFLTQVYIWKYVSNYNVKITDKNGVVIDDFFKDYNKLHSNVNYHRIHSTFFDTIKETEIWTTNTYSYESRAIILDSPKIAGLIISNNNRDINIYNEKVGNYKLIFKKEYDHETYCYTDSENIYWQSLKGPANLTKYLIYNVNGIKLNIKENIIGVNNRYGDSYLKSKYELYLEDDLKLTIESFNDIYVKSNSNYVLKDVSENKSINNSEDIHFKIEDEEYNLILDKYVVSKNLSMSIMDDKKYYIYLKSNNELYEIVDKNTDIIILPYGTYYVKDEENSYYKEFSVINNVDEELVIDNSIEETESESNNLEFNMANSNSLYIDEVIKNPETSSNTYIFINIIFISVSIILILKVYLYQKKLSL